VDQARRLLDTFRGAAPGGAAQELTGDCRWCPLCQAAAVVRGERPEVSSALADLLTATSAALRDLAGEPARADGDEGEPARQDRPAPVVQKIDLS
jgi:hypothetical protein